VTASDWAELPLSLTGQTMSVLRFSLINPRSLQLGFCRSCRTAGTCRSRAEAILVSFRERAGQDARWTKHIGALAPSELPNRT